MLILGKWKQGALARIIARQHHRHLSVQLDEPFQHARLIAESLERGTRFIRRSDACLAFAVIAEARYFQQRRRAGFCKPGFQLGFIVDHCKRGSRKAVVGEPCFFVAAILRNRHGVGAGRHAAMAGKFDQAGCRYVFEFRGDGRALFTQLLERSGVRVIRLNVCISHLSGRARCIRVEHHHPVTHRARGQREQAAKLAAAEYAQGGTGQNG